MTPRQLLETGIHPRWLAVRAPELDGLMPGFVEWRRRSAIASEEGTLALEWALYLLTVAESLRGEIEVLRIEFDNFSVRLSRAETEPDRRGHVLDFARIIGSDHSTPAKDKRGFSHWNGPEAVTDRYLDEIAEMEYRLHGVLDRLAAMASLALEDEGERMGYEALWIQLGLEERLTPFLTWGGDKRVASKAFQCLARVVGALPREMQKGTVSDPTLRVIYRTAMDVNGDTWVQTAALSLLQKLAPDDFAEVAQARLEAVHGGADIFVRRHVIELVGSVVDEHLEMADLLGHVSAEHSAHERQALAGAMIHIPWQRVEDLVDYLCQEDPEPCVRAASLLSLVDHMEAYFVEDDGRIVGCADILEQALENETDAFVLRAAIVAVERVEAAAAEVDPAAARAWRIRMAGQLELLHKSDKPVPVRRWAAQAKERLWSRSDPARWLRLDALAEVVQRTKPGRSSPLPHGFMDGQSEEEVGRLLAVLAQDDFGLEIRSGLFGPRLFRGPDFRIRFWRLLHELRHPASDKRQGFSHIIGRVYRGRIQAPPGRMGELSETKVPGEPLFIPEDGGWRPYVPLLDQILSAIDGGGVTKVFTAEGVTEIIAPPSLFRRMAARFNLSRTFPRLAGLRNWREGGAGKPSGYLSAIRGQGVEVVLRSHEGEVEATAARFFPLAIPGLDPRLWERFQSYFLSVFENNLRDLMLFVGAASALFLGRNAYLAWTLRKARRHLSLVIGGWGTRGKSGTERLKAGLMNALGHGTMSKTTGCEAMFVFAKPFRPMREMFLFRPYDKATIWEQHNVVRLAEKLNCRIFLWECMALTPSYVKILQRQWMKDDISTITNTYPDHEDVQGPAGWNIPEVMINFIPKGGRLISTEEEMSPILREGAKGLGTEMSSVGWLEAGLIAPDVLKRYPYEEHPYNIALVTALAAELGIGRDFALKEMADRVVPDLGVLKVYPTALVKGRQLEFVNGMSANERFGCMGNWTRMGFESDDPWGETRTWTMTVVNNRADREPRSKVFADIIARDIYADRHVLIGSNLEGLTGFIQAAWEQRVQGITLWPEEGDADPVKAFTLWCKRMRVCMTEAHLEAFKESSEEIQAKQRACMEVCQSFLADIQRGGDQGALNSRFRGLLTEWFNEKIVPVWDFHASGDEINSLLADITPAGLTARVMGMQNIKGTGLDFVYSWQAWERCYLACEKLLARNQELAWEGVRELSKFQALNLLSLETLRLAVASSRQGAFAQTESFQALLNTIEENLNNAEKSVAAKIGGETGEKQEGILTKAVSGVESFLDAGDAVKRRKKANRIYRELSGQRIGLERAVTELQGLNKRQKGGWLLQRLRLK